MGNENNESDHLYKWDSLRPWLISLLRIFLEYSERPDTKEAWDDYTCARRSSLESLDWKTLESLHDRRSDIAFAIYCEIDEADGYRRDAPGRFSDAAHRATAWLRVLEEGGDIEKVANEVLRIEEDDDLGVS